MRHALIQCCSHLDWHNNLTTIGTLCRQAHQAGAEVLVLPEYFACFGDFDRVQFARECTPIVLEWLSCLAQELGITLFAGTLPTLSSQAHKVYNTLHVFDASGLCRAQYHKIHLFDFDHGAYQESATHVAGHNSASIAMQGWSYALAICYDVRFPELYRSLLPFDILVLPAAFVAANGRAHWEVLLRARAIENQCYVLASAQEGMHQGGRETHGHSMIIDPWGEIIACLPHGEGWVMADLNHKHQETIRNRLPALKHRRV